MRFIGGFFELELPTKLKRQSLGQLWEVPADPALTFANARSAFCAFLSSNRPQKIWLPAYICVSMFDAATAAGIDTDWFPVGADLEPDITFLEEKTQPGDMVLIIDYFGRAPTPAFLNYAGNRNDLAFIEDAAQAFDTGQPRWAT